MAGFLEALKPVFDYILAIGNIVLLPLIIFLLATLWFKMKPTEAFRSALLIGIGYVGISMVTGFLTANLGPAVQAMSGRFGLDFNILDVGSAGSKFVAFGTPVGLAYIPVVIVVNLIMLALRLTKTVDIDIWNYWHMAFVGGLVYGVTGSFLIGTLAVALDAAIIFILADLTQPLVEKYFDLPGVSIPHGLTIAYVPLAWPFVKLFENIPGLKDLNVTAETIQKRFGVFGDPPIIGLIMGLLLGALGGLPLPAVLQLGVKMAGVFYLITRVVAILLEGLMPVAQHAEAYLKERFGGRQLFIGLDSALLIGDPAVMSVALLMMPISILLAVILPGNRFLPFADLVLFPFVFAMIVPMCKGNIIRAVLVSSVVMVFGLYFATYVAEAYTAAAYVGGMEQLAAGQLASSVLDSSTPTAAFFHFLASLVGG